jgi:hypothetical protein
MRNGATTFFIDPSKLFADIKELNCPSYFFLLTVMHSQSPLRTPRGTLLSGDKNDGFVKNITLRNK